jgi:ribosome maturation factor RimP
MSDSQQLEQTDEGALQASQQTLIERVRAVADPIAVAHGVSLFDVEWVGTHHGRVLRVSIDRFAEVDGNIVSQGVTVTDCARVSRDLSTVLDVEEVIADNYNLEVSSPGLDRPLMNGDDFGRHLGRLAKVALVEPSHDGQRVLRGTIEAVAGDEVTMRVDGNEHRFESSNIDRARLVFETGGAFGTKGTTNANKRTKGKRKKGNRKR